MLSLGKCLGTKSCILRRAFIARIASCGINKGQAEIRVRFAPSPTGSLHIGGVRTALYNWLFAKQTKGSFIIRVEDTDELRSSRESEKSILEDLKWIGIDWTEGPDLQGVNGHQYRQSERKSLYTYYANKLVEEGKAYRCFCVEDKVVRKSVDIDNAGEEAAADRKWRDADPVEIQRRLDNKEPYTVRFAVPGGKKVILQDRIFGEVVWDTDSSVDDFILLRSNGMPVYNFCVSVDDMTMRISHVIRAQEHLTNTLKQLLLMEALGHPPPIYAHCSILLGKDGTKLSKRNGAASVAQFREEGYLPSALVTYLGGFKPAGAAEKVALSTEEVVAAFSLDRIQRGASMFDIDYLKHLNREYVRAMKVEEVQKLVLGRLGPPWSADAGVEGAAPSLQPSVLHFDMKNIDLKTQPEVFQRFIAVASKIAQRDMVLLSETNRLVSKCLRYDLAASLEHDPLSSDVVKDVFFYPIARALWKDYEEGGTFPTGVESNFSEVWKAYVKRVSETLGVKGKQLFHALRLCLTGSLSGPDIADQLQLVGLAGTPGVHPLLHLQSNVVLLPERMKAIKKLCDGASS